MPLIERELRAQPGAPIGLAGDSYAGVAALHAAMQRPERIAWLLLESPALQVGQLLEEAERDRRWPAAVYLGVGTAEGATPAIQASTLANVRRLHSHLAALPEGPRTHLLVREGAVHWFDAWRERLPEALRFLLSEPAAAGR